MADNLPVNFPIPQSSALANYDWTDFVEGLGVKEFDLFIAKTSAGTETFGLSENIGAGRTLYKDDDFEHDFVTSAFNRPAIIQGKAIMEFTRLYDGQNAGNIAAGSLTLTIYKTSGAVDTELVTGTTDHISMENSKECISEPMELIIPLTSLKIGDKIKIRVDHNVSLVNAARTVIPFDPLNRAISYVFATRTIDIDPSVNPTTFKVKIPFKINL